jgi:predicted SprT family Zn-dependent metalloprotease
MDNKELEMLLKEATWQTYCKYFPDLLENSLEECEIEISFDLDNTKGGTADSKVITYNLTLARENLVEFFGTIVPHETAHLIDRRVNGFSSHHGENWKAIMFRLGIENPKATHDFDTSNVNRGRKNFCLECQECHKKYWVTERVANKINNYHCKCKGKFNLVSSAYDALDD